MNRRRLEREVEAYRDGTLPDRQAQCLRTRLAADPEAQTLLARHEALGRFTREAWSDAPPPPPVPQLIAALRPGLARIDAEIEAARPQRGRLWWVPAPVAAMGAVALLALAILRGPTLPSRSDSGAASSAAHTERSPALEVRAASTAAAAAEPTERIPVYDLAQKGTPLMVFEDGGTTFIWLIEPERDREDLSALPRLREGLV